MKFKNLEQVTTWYCTTEDGTEYRTCSSGESWQRRYGESWEPVMSYDEEKACRVAWVEVNGWAEARND